MPLSLKSRRDRIRFCVTSASPCRPALLRAPSCLTSDWPRRVRLPRTSACRPLKESSSDWRPSSFTLKFRFHSSLPAARSAFVGESARENSTQLLPFYAPRVPGSLVELVLFQLDMKSRFTETKLWLSNHLQKAPNGSAGSEMWRLKWVKRLFFPPLKRDRM